MFRDIVWSRRKAWLLAADYLVRREEPWLAGRPVHHQLGLEGGRPSSPQEANTTSRAPKRGGSRCRTRRNRKSLPQRANSISAEGRHPGSSRRRFTTFHRTTSILWKNGDPRQSVGRSSSHVSPLGRRCVPEDDGIPSPTSCMARTAEAGLDVLKRPALRITRFENDEHGRGSGA